MALVTIVLQDQPIKGDPEKTKLVMSLFSNPEINVENLENSPAIAAASAAYLVIQKLLGEVEVNVR